MGTQFEEIFGVFLSKVSDYSFISLTEEQLDGQLFDYLRSAIPKFRKVKVDLSDRFDDSFADDLSDEEIEILATLMLVEYLKPIMINSRNLKQNLTDREYKVYSQANHLKQLMDLYKEMRKEAVNLVRDYSYNDIDFNRDAKRVNTYVNNDEEW